MQNTIRYALFLLIVSGVLFTACKSEVEDPEMTLPSNEEVEEETGIDTLEMEEETDEDGNPVPEVEDSEDANTTSSSSGSNTVKTEAAEESSVYEDGTYSATGTYTSPAGPESIKVTLTVKDDVVTGVSVQPQASNEKSVNFQNLFATGISAQVVGKSLDEIGGFSSVNGSSLTPDGFDAALADIQAQAS